MPTRLLPDGHDQPYRYVPASPEMADALLATYDATIEATAPAATALSNLAQVLNLQPTRLVTFPAITQPGITGLPPTLAASDSWPGLRPAPGTVEQVLRSRGISEPALLARAADIDDTTRNLIRAATAISQRQAAVSRQTRPAPEGPPDRRQHPASLAAKDSPSATTGSRTPLPRLVPINHRIRHGAAARRKPTP